MVYSGIRTRDGSNSTNTTKSKKTNGKKNRGNKEPIRQKLPANQPVPSGTDNTVYVSDFSGRKKALLVGINYFGTGSELGGCINDVQNVKSFITEHYGFNEYDMIVLTDDQKDPKRIPTRANIIQAMRWLVDNAHPNDSFFFHYSGHGGSVEDLDGDESDGFDECICPVDYAEAGNIIDDELNDIMVKPLPKGCRLTAIFDCCHSGTALDLPYMYDEFARLKAYSPAKVAKVIYSDLGKKYMMGDLAGAMLALKNGYNALASGHKAKQNEEKKGSLADVVMFSGCMDTQTSADIYLKDVGRTGALSHAIIQSLISNPHATSYIQLLNDIRAYMEKGKYTQVPMLSTGRPMDMNTGFNM